MATIPNRIKAFAETIGSSVRQIEIKTGASNGTFSKAITQNRDIGSNWIEKIVAAYPDLNPYWLVTGQGEMMVQKGNLKGNPNSNPSENVQLNVQPIVNKKQVKQPELAVLADDPLARYEGKSRAIPILDARAAAGWPYTIDGTGFLDQRPTISLPFGWFQSGEYVLIQIEGDSMHPTIYNGDWAFVRRIEKNTDIKDGYVHIVLTRDGIVCKRVLNRPNKGQLALQSDNSAYSTYTVPYEEIISVWKVEMKMSAILRNENLDIIKRLNGIEADLAEMKAKKKS
jgi:phage repressor protein C with HTH and peptisase S24 domain